MEMPKLEFDNSIVHITLQQRPLDRALLDKGMKDILDMFNRFVPVGDPRRLEVEKQGLKDLDKVIEMGIAYCYHHGVLATVEGVLEDLENKLADIKTPPQGPQAYTMYDSSEDESEPEDEAKHKHARGPLNTSQPDTEDNSKNQNAGTSTESSCATFVPPVYIPYTKVFFCGQTESNLQ
ncbi:hypothetical protein MIND_00002600 [Mycena indigotica]|uniref:Uncharacterized protein n=1 Tax=Mycena indigotica TaxID=2126181 RepID=A0A8H6TC01_9AGAR|nr:uncharacterized protein MIND_00002600 [Mycena indigotica]KAF7314888.1 hypothetical protein MIND_00002600 [Mycena indigotica]